MNTNELILVTGAAGHVGANLTHALVERGNRVRVLLRENESAEAFDNIDVEKVYGDLREKQSLVDVVRGVDRIFHVASMVSTIDGDHAHRRTIYDTNVIGTRNLLEVAQDAGVKRTVVTGSFSAVGYDLDQPDRPANETLGFYPYHRAMPYERSKVLQEHEVLKAVARGQDALICTSCAVIGGHDYFPSRMGRTLCDFVNGDLRAYVKGGFEFVAAQDLINGHMLAMEKGKAGEKYIITTEFLTLDDIMGIWEEMTGVPRPKMKLPTQIMLPFAEVASWYLSRFHPKFPQRLTPGAIRRLQLQRHADITKAKAQLGYQPTSIRDAFMDAYRFHTERGAIKNKKANPPTAIAKNTSTKAASSPMRASL